MYLIKIYRDARNLRRIPLKKLYRLLIILAIILCSGCGYIQSPEDTSGENKKDIQCVNMDGLRQELASIQSKSFENLDIKDCAFFDVPVVVKLFCNTFG